MNTSPFDPIQGRAMSTSDRHGRVWPRETPEIWSRRPVRLAPVLSLITALAGLAFVGFAIAAYRGN